MVLDMLSEMRKVVVNNLQFGISSKKWNERGDKMRPGFRSKGRSMKRITGEKSGPRGR